MPGAPFGVFGPTHEPNGATTEPSFYNPSMGSQLPGYPEAAAVVAAYAKKLARQRPENENVVLRRVAGRVLAEDLCADRDQPPFARSTRDGFACRAEEAAAHLWLQVAGSTRAGEPVARRLKRGETREIMTGAAVPPGADCVAMLEHIEREGDRVRLAAKRTIAAGENVVARGAQARRGALLLKAGTVIGAAQVALAASCGYARLAVCRRPRVAILATGDEIVPIVKTPGPAQIRNSNAPMLAEMVKAAGGEPWVLPQARDNEQALENAFRRALEADLLVVTGGVSAGKFDLVEPVLARMGARFHFTGVRIQPGKPLVFGEIARRGAKKLPFFGLPGNPVSSAVTFLLFAAQVVRGLAGRAECGARFALAQLSKTPAKKAKAELTRFLPAACTFGADGELPDVELVEWQGSGDIGAMARANCFLVFPEGAEQPERGSTVRILLW